MHDSQGDRYLMNGRDLDEVIQITGALVGYRTFSQTGDRVERRELRLAIDYIREILKPHDGVRVEVLEFPAGPVLVADVGPQDGRRVTLLGHLDVVPEDDQARCELLIRDGAAWGRGAADMKVAVAGTVHMLRVLAARDRALARAGVAEEERCAVRVILDGDEEQGGASFAQYVRQVGASSVGEFVIALEPTASKISLQCKGDLRVGYRVVGMEAHSSRPREGIDAIRLDHAFKSVVYGMALPPVDNPYYSDGVTLAFTTHKGGRAGNIIPALAEGTIDVRYPAPLVEADILTLIAAAAEQCHVTLEVLVRNRAVTVSAEHPHVRALATALGDPEPFIAQPGSCDLAHLPEKTPCGEYGLGSDHHTPCERVPVSHILRYNNSILGYTALVPGLPR